MKLYFWARTLRNKTCEMQGFLFCFCVYYFTGSDSGLLLKDDDEASYSSHVDKGPVLRHHSQSSSDCQDQEQVDQTIEHALPSKTSISVLLDNDDPTKKLKINTVRSNDGIFETFILNYVHMLITAFTGRKLKNYCVILYRELEKLEFKVTAKMAKKIKRLSKKKPYEIQEELETYKEELQRVLPKRTEFLQAINEVFTLREKMQFDDYIYDLVDYGSRRKLNIEDETRRIIHDVIVGSIFKFKSAREQEELYDKLNRAIKEYENS